MSDYAEREKLIKQLERIGYNNHDWSELDLQQLREVLERTKQRRKRGAGNRDRFLVDKGWP